jgi:hypothetical protein
LSAVVSAVVVGRQIKLYRSSINQQSRPHSGCRLLKVVSVVVLSEVISVVLLRWQWMVVVLLLVL